MLRTETSQVPPHTSALISQNDNSKQGHRGGNRGGYTSSWNYQRPMEKAPTPESVELFVATVGSLDTLRECV